MKTIQEKNQSKSSEETGIKQKKDTKFKKGQSGNPKGRPKESFSLLTILKRELQQIPPELKGKERKMYADMLVKKQLYKAIIEGDEQSIKLIWNYVEGVPKGNLEIEMPEITKELQETREMLNNMFNGK